MNDPLKTFLLWWLSQPLALLASMPANTPPVIVDNEKVLTVVLFREAPFQVELVVVKPETAAWPGEHRHPNVDSFEVELFNNFNFTKNGSDVVKPDVVVNVGNLQARCVRLLPTDFHGARPRVEGATLLSVQQWVDVEPTSVGRDWLGTPVAAGHARFLATV